MTRRNYLYYYTMQFLWVCAAVHMSTWPCQSINLYDM